mgnify:CR=1 FL=1
MNAYLGEIRMFGGNFAPDGWAFCDGSLLLIDGNVALFSLIGTTYGGDGLDTFVLPDLRGRIPIHKGQGDGLTERVLGENGGVESVTLSVQQMPTHTHTVDSSVVKTKALASKSGTTTDPIANYRAIAPDKKLYGTTKSTDTTNRVYTADLFPERGDQPHDNMMPSLCVNFIICLNGIFPKRN